MLQDCFGIFTRDVSTAYEQFAMRYKLRPAKDKS
jgi:hypothetical protein